MLVEVKEETMTLKKNIQWLIDNGYCVLVNKTIVFTSKVNQELKGSGISAAIEEPPTPKEEIKGLSDDPKQVWAKFIEDAEIPHRVIAPDGGRYTVRQYSPANAKKLVAIINNARVDYIKLVESTKNYYKTVTYKALLSNYLEKDLWVHEYNEWKGKAKVTGKGENPFED